MPRHLRTIHLPVAGASGVAVTTDGRYLLVAAGSGAVVLDVARAETPRRDAVAGVLSMGGPASAGDDEGALDVVVSPEGRYVYVSLEFAGQIAVYDLQTALSTGFRRARPVALIPLDTATGLAVSPDGHWLYATAQIAHRSGHDLHGTISVIDLTGTEREPRYSVVSTRIAGCSPVRVAVSADGDVVWVTARESNALLGFSAAKLRSDPRRALLAQVRVGEAPVALMLLRNGARALVADSNRFSIPGRYSDVAVVDTAAAIRGKPSLLGVIAVGRFPRSIALVKAAHAVLAADFGSAELEALSIRGLP